MDRSRTSDAYKVADLPASRLAKLEIGVLYKLNRLGADVGEPIALTVTSDGRIKMTGIVATSQQLVEINRQLATLPDRDLIENTLASPDSLQEKAPAPRAGAPLNMQLYEGSTGEPPAYDVLRSQLRSSGLTGPPLEEAVRQRSNEILKDSQKALQNAYALERLGSILVTAGVPATDTVTREQWAEMVRVHSASLQAQIEQMRSQLGTVVHSELSSNPPTADSAVINSPVQFASASREVRISIQTVNLQIGSLFANGPSEGRAIEANALIRTTRNALPFSQVSELIRFSQKLSHIQDSERRGEDPDKGNNE